LSLISRGLVNFCWFLFKWCLLAGVVGVAIAVPCLYRRVDEQIRRRVHRTLAEHYAGLKVTVRSAQLVEGEGIEVRDVSIVDPGMEGPGAELIHVEELFLACRADLEELITGEPQVTHVVLRRPTLRDVRLPDGSSSAAKLLPPPEITWPPPKVTVEDGVVEIVYRPNGAAGPVTLREVNLTLAPPEAPGQRGVGARPRRLEGTLTGDFLGRMQLAGLVDPHHPDWMIEGSIDRLEICPELCEALPAALASKLAVLGSLRGQVELAFHVSHDSSAPSPYLFDLAGRLARGRLDYPRLPQSVTDLRAAFRLNNNGFAVDELSASSGQSTLRMSCRRDGYGDRSPLRLDAEIRSLKLDRQLMNILPDVLREQWLKYFPAGQVDVDLTLTYDGQTWRPVVSVECLDVSLSYYKFPYRLQQGKGTVTLKDDVLTVDLTAYSGSEPVRLSGRIFHPLSGPSGVFEAAGDNLELDEKLFRALEAFDPRSCEVVRSLEPRGTVGFSLELWRDRPGEPLRKRLLIGLNRCSIRYQKFPYPLGNVRGTLEMHDDRWTFRDLEGTNDTGRVTGEGHLVPTPQGRELLLRLAATDVPLEQELHDALGHGNMWQVWNDLKLRGTVDLPHLEVRYISGQRKPSVAFRAELDSASTSIEPLHFPYHLDKLRGAVDYGDGHVSFQRIKAEHGDVSLSLAGRCDFLPDGSWRFDLTKLAVDRLRVDRDLIQALPGRLKDTVVHLDPAGPLNLSGSLRVGRGGLPDDPLTAQWDLELGFYQGSVDLGVKLRNIHGSVNLIGGFDGRHLHSLGELAVDSVNCKEIQLTELRGPIWIDDDQVLFGTAVGPQRSGRPAREITARVFGGTLNARGRIARGADSRYRLQAGLSDADLARCAQEVLAGHQDLRGKIQASVDLWGEGRSLNSLGGRGRVQLRDADVYELPLMIALLKILSIREPDRSAFSESDVDFVVEGPHVYFPRIEFRGDVISLEGRGEMDLQTAIRLTFRARLGRRQFAFPGIKELLGGASEQIMLIHVGGTLQNPVTTREPFPGVNQALQQFQSDLQKSTRPKGILPQGGRWMPDALLRLPKME